VSSAGKNAPRAESAWRLESDLPVRQKRRRLADSRTVLALVAADGIALIAAYAAAFLVRIWLPVPLTSELLPASRAAVPHDTLWIALLSQSPLFYFFGLYDTRLLRQRHTALGAAALALGIQVLIVTAWYFFRADLDFPRSVLLIFAALDLTLVAVVRLVARQLLGRSGRPLRVALVGPAAEVLELAGLLRGREAGHPVEIVGALRTDGPAPIPERAAGGLRWLSGARELGRLSREGTIDQVIISPAEPRQEDPLERVLRATESDLPPEVAVVPSMHELRVGRLASLNIDDVPLIEVSRNPQHKVAHAAKMGMDYALAATLSVIALPVCALAAVAIRLDSRGPIFYRQRRVGRGGREFMMYKLRTMRDDAEEATGPVLARDGDERVTSVGRLLRATRIDELPQLLNVLNGTMSLIGPRPERPEFVAELVRRIPGYRERWLVKPGLTGLAQVRGEYHTSPAYKLKYDLAYIHNYSLLLDLRIMAETVKALLTRRGV
jgi:exopolysaccharide biosynthesis polyprenyl glycosylphosphotransferase